MKRILEPINLWRTELDRSRFKESKVFCMAPWVSLHVAPQGHVFPCCISAHYLEERQGDMRQNSLEEIWNSPKMKTLRQNMLAEKRSKQCELCYQYEKVGEKSSRQDFNKEFGDFFNLIDHHTTKDGGLDKYEIRYVDFRVSNLCNFRCRICSHHFSTSWFTESVKLGLAKPDQKRLVVPMDDPEDIWNQIETMLPYLEHIHFAGGEPMITEEHYRILNYLVEHNRFNVKLSYNTNFSEMAYKGQDVMLLWKKFRTVTVCASLDGMGSRGELMRKGQNWEQTVINRKRMLKVCPNVTFILTPAVGVLNVLHLPDFYRYCVENRLLKPKHLNVYLVFEPEFYNIQTLPEFFKQRIRDKYDEFLKTYVSKFRSRIRATVEAQFTRVLDHLNNPEEFRSDLESYHQQTLTSFNDKLDALRDEDVVSVFPELKDLYTNRD